MYVYFPSIVSDVGVKGTITPCDVHFAARFCLQLSAPLFEACFPPPPPLFYIYFYFSKLFPLVMRAVMSLPSLFSAKKVLEIRTRGAEI